MAERIKPIQFTLRRFLLAIAVVAALIAIAVDANRRYAKIGILSNSVANPTQAELRSAEREMSVFMTEMAVLCGIPAAVGIGLFLKWLDVPRLRQRERRTLS